MTRSCYKYIIMKWKRIMMRGAGIFDEHLENKWRYRGCIRCGASKRLHIRTILSIFLTNIGVGNVVSDYQRTPRGAGGRFLGPSEVDFLEINC